MPDAQPPPASSPEPSATFDAEWEKTRLHNKCDDLSERLEALEKDMQAQSRQRDRLATMVSGLTESLEERDAKLSKLKRRVRKAEELLEQFATATSELAEAVG